MTTRRSGEAGRGRPSGRGTPLWCHLAALVLLPLLGLTALGTAVVGDRRQEAQRAALALDSVRSVRQLDVARSAVDQEVMPTLVDALLHQPDLATRLGFAPFELARLSESSPLALARARRRTDAALAALPEHSPASRAAAPAAARLRALRRAAAASSLPVPVLAERLLDVSSTLAGVEDRSSDEAASQAPSHASVLADQDLQQVAALAQAAGQELPLLFTSRLDDARARRIGWLSTWGTATSASTGLGDLTNAQLRVAARALDNGTTTFLEDDLAAQALDSGTPQVGMADLVGLVDQDAWRDQLLSSLVGQAATLAQRAASTDRATASGHVRTTLLLLLVASLLSAAAVFLLGRAVTTSLRDLARSALRVSRGHLVDVPDAGPAEVRTVARALGGAVGTLRQVQSQISAVARGDLSDALVAAPLPGPLGQVVHDSVVEMVTAVHQREQLRSDLAHQAAHDPLTDLPNRAQALALLTAALHRAQRSGSTTGLLFVDVDHFKAVNDTHGHAAGDEVLRVVAARLGAAVRSGDAVARLGGDEFVALVEAVEGERDLVELADRVVAQVSLPVDVGGQLLEVGVSVGVAVCRDGGTEADALLAEADVAVHRAKTSGRARAEVFDDALRAELSARAELEAALTAGLAGGELRLHYQPVVEAATGHLEGYEALVRWQRPGHGLVPPDTFIGVAEGSSLICELGRWVLHEATRQLATWRASSSPAASALGGGSGAGPEGGARVAVNISGRHLADARVVTDVTDALAASGLPAALLVLEITETVLVDDPVATERLHELRAMGVRISLDDFGTGYTSIGQLGRMPVDVLKVDRSFVASDDPGQQRLVGLMVAAAHTFGLSVVAEGVEEVAQLDRLRAEGCDLVQGYLLSRPVPPEQVGDAVQRLTAQRATLWPTVPQPRSLDGATTAAVR